MTPIGAKGVDEVSFGDWNHAVSRDHIWCDAAATIHHSSGVSAESLVLRRWRIALVVARSRSSDRPAHGSEPSRRRQLETALVPERDDALRASLPLRRRSDDERAIVVLQRSGHYLGGAGAASIDEHDQRKVWPALLSRIGEFPIRFGKPAVHADDLLPGIQEQIGYSDSLSQQSARIRAQIEDECLHSVRKKAVDRPVQLLPRRIAERLQIDVPDAVAEQRRSAHRALMNCRPHEPDLHRSQSAGTLDLKCHGGASFAAQRLGCLFAGPSLRGLVHDLDDAVARLQSGALGGAGGARG